MYTTPARITAQSEKTLNSSPEPLITKNSTITGPVQRSMRSISSSEKSQRLQNTVPIIMQTRSDEKPTVTGPILNSSMERATARKTYVTENPGYEKEGIRLNSIPINGGYAFWIEDIRQHRAAYESLYELREELRDRNQLLKLEYQKEKERKQAEEKNRLYDLMQKQTAEQFQQIAGYVDQLEQCTDHREYHRLLGKILIVGSYLKRRKNLTLSALEGKELKEEELIQSLRESCSNLVFCEIQGQYYIETGKETLPAQLVLRAYDFFEQIVELLLKQGGSFFYRLTELNGVLRISVNLEGDCQTESLQEKYPLLHMEQEEEKEWFLALQLSEKGGNDEIL